MQLSSPVEKIFPAEYVVGRGRGCRQGLDRLEEDMSSDSLHFPCQVTTMVSRRIRPGFDDEYAAGLREAAATARGFEGHQGVTILGPHGGPPSEITAIFTFDSSVNLERWMTSDERRRWLDRARDLTVDDGDVESLSGLEPWFTLPNRVVNRPPARWKMALLTALGVYPMLLFLGVLLKPLVGDWPVALRLGASLVVGIPLMTWVIMPGLSRLFFGWLYPEPQRGALRSGVDD